MHSIPNPNTIRWKIEYPYLFHLTYYYYLFHVDIYFFCFLLFLHFLLQMSQTEFFNLVSLYSQDKEDLLQEPVLVQLAKEIKHICKNPFDNESQFEIISSVNALTESLCHSLTNVDDDTLEILSTDKALFSLLCE